MHIDAADRSRKLKNMNSDFHSVRKPSKLPQQKNSCILARIRRTEAERRYLEDAHQLR